MMYQLMSYSLRLKRANLGTNETLHSTTNLDMSHLYLGWLFFWDEESIFEPEKQRLACIMCSFQNR